MIQQVHNQKQLLKETDMNFTGTGKRIEDIDIPRAGKIIGVGEDEVHAVMDVETRGGGFDARDRPKMLFEPHIFYRQLSEPQRDRAVRVGLARKRWKRDYPSDSYPKLEKAMLINKEAALKSASWGLGQVMGFNHQLAGYPSAEAMVKDFMRGEDKQLSGMILFIKNSGLGDELRDHDWSGFARGYNGKGYKKNRYHIKLKKAFDKWSKIKDTPFKIQRSPEKEIGFLEILIDMISKIMKGGK
jgi:hypothetical protein